jgi:hypothetical protein
MLDMNEEEYQKELARLKERERSLMRQLDLARATIAFQAYGIPKRPLESSESANRVFTSIMSLPIVEDPK